ncbi:MAG: ABC transporter ATP-binding protein [Nitrososphaerales archaeon]
MSKTLIEVRNLTKLYNGGLGKPITALQDVNFSVAKEEFFTIIGPSGCGKSTLLNLIAGLDKPSSGEVLVNGVKINKPNPQLMAIMFQEHALYNWRTVLRNVEFGLEIRGVSKAERRTKALHYIRLVGLQGFEDKYPNQLSGGMKQRAALARALSLETDILLMDEPFGALDEQTRLLLGLELTRIWQETKKTIIFVTHSLSEAAFLSDRILVMSARPGRVKRIYNVDIRRPRDPNSDEVNHIKALIWNEIKDEALSMMKGG